MRFLLFRSSKHEGAVLRLLFQFDAQAPVLVHSKLEDFLVAKVAIAMQKGPSEIFQILTTNSAPLQLPTQIGCIAP